MKKPICLKCLQQYRVSSIGRMIIYKSRPENGQQRNIGAIMADVYRCPSCQHEIVTAFAQNPLAVEPMDVDRWAEGAKSAIVVIV